MFSTASQSLPLGSRASGVALGSVIMVAVPVCLVSAKTIQISLPLLLTATLLSVVIRREPSSRMRMSTSAAAMCLFVFILYAGCSSLWSPEPQATGLIVAMVAVIATGSLLLAQLLRTGRVEDLAHIREGLWIGLLVGLVYTVIEAASDQSIKIWVYNTLRLEPAMLEPSRFYTWLDGRVVAIHSDDLKRNAFSIPLLLWPALMAAATIASLRLRITVKLALLALSFAAVALSTSQTSKLALVAGLTVYLVARYSGQAARWGLSLAWALACLGMVPAVLFLRHLELHNSTVLQLSAQLRIMIWNRIAQLVPAAPVFGVGADMTYYIRPTMIEAPRGAPDWLGFPIPHPYNVYLQVWYELGLVGAVLLTAFGLLLLRQVGKLGKADRPFAYATFAATAAAISSSYNVWQIWFMCLFGFVAAMFALGQTQPDTCGSHATVGEKVS